MARVTQNAPTRLFDYPIRVASQLEQDRWKARQRSLSAGRGLVCTAM